MLHPVWASDQRRAHQDVVVLPAQVYPPELVAALKTAIDTNLESELETAYERIPFQGSSHQINNVPDPSIVRMLSHPAAVDRPAARPTRPLSTPTSDPP